jgi:hypothetical protein
MDIYEKLRRQVHANRVKDIQAAHDRYKLAIQNINALQAMMGFGRNFIHTREMRRSGMGTPFSRLTALEAADRVLTEGVPLTLAELTLEVQRRGCRAKDDPRRLHKAIASAFHYHKHRFVRDGTLKWTAI